MATAKERYHKFLYKQLQKGVALAPDKIQLLKEHGFIEGFNKPQQEDSKAQQRKVVAKQLNWEESMDPFKDAWRYKKMNPVETSEWKPDSAIFHTSEFISWIDSFLYGSFTSRVFYAKYDKYVAQAWQWLQDTDNITDYSTTEGKRSFIHREYTRCSDSTLYFANKYGELKEGDISSGYVKYKAREHHSIIFYLCDCGYNLLGGKGRQIGFTSGMGLYALKKQLFQANFYAKFITEDADTGEEIFNDKIKYPYGALPKWMQPRVRSDAGKRFWLSNKTRKGEKGYPNSRIDVIAPKATAINGGSPQLAMVDEIGNIGILGAMLNEARPTMFWNNPVTGAFELKRQLVAWGCLTAGNKVFTNDGRVINIEELQQEDGAVGYDGSTACMGDINWMKPPAEKPCYRIETEGGNFIECSDDHPIMWTRRKFSHCRDNKSGIRQVTFKEAKDIVVGDQLASCREVPIFGSKSFTYARLLGLLIGDGNYTGGATNLYINDDEIASYVETLDVTKKKRVRKEHREYYIKNFKSILIRHGIHGQSCFNKTLPKDIHLFNKKSLSELIAGLYDSDGNVNYNEKSRSGKIVLTSCQREILEQVKYQLIKFGISSSIFKENRGAGGYGNNMVVYRLYISRASDVVKFKANIPILCKHKTLAINKIAKVPRAGNARVNDKADYTINNNCAERGEFFEGMNDMRNLKFDRVTKVEYLGRKPVYNINVSETHTYLANGFITHNTGGKMAKGQGAYEKEWYRILGLWENGEHEASGVVPIFFSWHARFAKEDYLKEKAWYYGARANEEDIDIDTSKTQFHQHYPSSPKDMFLTTANTLVSREIIEEGLERCKGLSSDLQPVMGYFEPIYDRSDPMPVESDVPFRITGAEFVPINDGEVRKATTLMFQKPESGWKFRYWQGTDPISTESGYSKMASVIWDEYLKTASCIVNFRKQHDHKYCFLQSLLMGLYYSPGEIKEGVKELVECNIGTNYIDYKQAKGFFNSLIFNSELPNKVTGGTREVGVDKKGNRADAIIDYLTEVVRTHHNRLYIGVIFTQLLTYVQRVTATGKEIWTRVNKSSHFDDVLDALAYAYIARQSYSHVNPTRTALNAARHKVVFELARDADHNLIRIPKRVPVHDEVMTEIPELNLTR